MKKFLAMLLAALMVLSASAVTAFAANGPSEAKYDEHYLAYISFYSFNGTYVNYSVFSDNKADNSAIAGASYSRASNTLTLKNFNHPELNLETNMMGDDFKIKVEGTCSTGAISVWGDGHGGSLLITGSGTLNVNKQTKADTAITLHPEGCEAKLIFDGSVSVNLYAQEQAALIAGVEKTASKTGFSFADGKEHSAIIKNNSYKTPVTAMCYFYSNPEENSESYLGYKVKKAGDSSIYTASIEYSGSSGDYESDDERPVKSYYLEKYIYSPKHNFYLQDMSFDATLTPEQFAAQGYELVYDDVKQDYPESLESERTATRIRCDEYTDESGEKFYLWSGGYVISELGENIIYTAEPINGVENEYLFEPIFSGVEIEDLTKTNNELNGYYVNNDHDRLGQRAVCESDPDGIYTAAHYTSTDSEGNESEGYVIEKYIYLPEYQMYIRDTSFGDYSSYYGCSFYGEKKITVEQWENSDFSLYYPVVNQKVELTNPYYRNWSAGNMTLYTDKSGKKYATTFVYSDGGSKQIVLDLEKIDVLEDAYWGSENTNLTVSDLTALVDTVESGTVNYILEGTAFNYKGNGSIPYEITAGASIEDAKVSGIKSKTYNGKAQTQSVTVKLDGKTLVKGTDYTVSYKNNKNAGTATMTIIGKGDYTGSIKKTFKIAKAKNPMTVSFKKSVTADSKKAATIKAALTVKKAQGTVTYKTDNKKVTVKNGVMTVAKGLKKGKTITVKVTVTAKGNANYNKASKTVAVKVKVK